MTAIALHSNNPEAATELPKPAKPKKRVASQAKTQPVVARERYIVLGLGCSIPILSLALSCMAGHMLAVEGCVAKIMGLFTMGLCLTILGVSLNHLADAIG